VSVSVVYLDWKHSPKGFKDNFLASYDQNDAGWRHDLIILPWDKGMDIEAYYQIAGKLDTDFLLFLNTYTLIRKPMWLDKMMQFATLANVGMVGGFGSYEQCPNGGTRFPNPHIRTNCFLMQRTLMLRYPLRPTTKNECYDFESGIRSIGRWLEVKELYPVLVTSEGGYYSSEWKKQRGFRQHNQEQLLFSDRQSREYDIATPEERDRMHKLAWGET